MEALAQSPIGETFRAKVYGVAGLERQYALKQVDAILRSEPAMRARLVDAARRYAAIEHERIARLTEIHDEGDECWLVSELPRGIDLPRLVAHLKGRGESLPVEQAILIAIDVAEALAVGDARHVLHEGLWPSVVMVLGEGEVRVADFAIASALERPGWVTDDSLVSILGYVAPERLRGEAATAQSDVWSLGALTFELCTGAPLYAGDNIAALGAQRSQGPAWDKLPSRPGLREALERMLADDPAQRPASASIARETLTGLLGLELGRTRQGLQGLVKRALGRALTRTGSFAAVAIPSTILPALVPDAPLPPSVTVASGPRTLLGVPTHAAASNPPKAEPQNRAWAPPRTTGTFAAVSADEPTRRGPSTLQGLGEPAPRVDGHTTDAMEVATLPPDESADITHEQPKLPATEKSMEAVLAFDDEIVTSKREREAASEAEIELTGSEDEVASEPTRLAKNRIPSGAQAVLPPPPSDVPPALQLPSLRVSSPMPATPEDVPGPDVDESLAIEMTAEPPPIPSSRPAIDPDLTPLPPPHPLHTQSVTAIQESSPTIPTVDRAAVETAAAERKIEPLAVTLPPLDKPAPITPPVASSSNRAVFFGAIFGTLAVAGGIAFFMNKPEQTVVKPPTITPPPVEAPKPVETAQVEPKVEAPKPVEPKPEPKVEAPKPVEPKVEAPKPVEPKVEAPKPVEPKPEPKVEAPKPVEPTVPVAAAAGQISVSSTPPGAIVWLDGVNKGATPLSAPATAGAHKLTLVGNGQKLFTKQVTVGQDGLALTQPLEAAHLPTVGPATQGGLKVRCHTSGELRILVDGVDTGLTCPNDVRIPVEPGSHQIGLYSPRTGETHMVDGEIKEDSDHSTRIYVRY